MTSEQWAAVHELRRAMAQFEDAEQFRAASAWRLWKSGLSLRDAGRMVGVAGVTVRRWSLKYDWDRKVA